jgi:hypothetical protein
VKERNPYMRAVDLMFQLEIGGSTKILGKIVSSITAVLRKLTRLLAAHIQKREYQLEQKPPTPVEVTARVSDPDPYWIRI